MVYLKILINEKDVLGNPKLDLVISFFLNQKVNIRCLDNFNVFDS